MGIPTVIVTALYTVAQRVGANRIVQAGGRFHCPFGQPELSSEKEVIWRKQVVEAALKALTIAVDRPTVFRLEDLLV